MELGKIDNKKLIAYAIMGIVVIIIIIMGISANSSKEDDINEIQIEDKNSTYDSKLSAYKAKQSQKEPVNANYNFDVSEYLKKEEEQKEGVYQEDDEEVKRLQQNLKEQNKTKTVYKPSSKTSNSVKEPTSIQNLEATVKTSTPVTSQQPNAAPVEKEASNQYMNDEAPKKTNRFYRGGAKEEKGNTTPAVVHGEQTVSDGSTILMRTLEDIRTKEDVLIPKNTYISGIVSLSNERLVITIQSVRIGKNIYAISKDVYDLDGIRGLNVPENVKAELAKQASAKSIESANTRTSNNVLSTVGNAVGDAAKSVLSKDKKEIKVTIKNNYKIFLK